MIICSYNRVVTFGHRLEEICRGQDIYDHWVVHRYFGDDGKWHTACLVGFEGDDYIEKIEQTIERFKCALVEGRETFVFS